MGPLTEQRMEQVITELKNANGRLVSGKELMDRLGMKKSNFYTLMMTVKKVHPNRISSMIGGFDKDESEHGYAWIAPPENTVATKSEDAVPLAEKVVELINKEETPKDEAKSEPVNRFDDKHTEEGYPDPTAFIAMKTLERETTFDNANVAPGDVWRYMGNNGGMITLVVVASRKNMVSVIPIYYDLNDVFPSEREEMVKLCVAGQLVYFNPGKLSAKPYKYFEAKVGEFSEKAFNELKCHLGLYLGINNEAQVITHEVVRKEPVEVGVPEEEVQKRIDVAVKEALESREPVVKEVIKEVEVPVCGGGISEEEVQERIKKAVEEAVLICERDIYKNILFKELKR